MPDIKVLHVIPGLASRYGGPSTTIVPIVHYLKSMNIQVDLATTDADGPSKSLVKSDLDISLRHAKIFHRRFSESWKYSPDMGVWLEQHVAEYDLVHIHALWSYSTQAAARAALRSNTPYIIRPAGMLSGFSWRNKSLRKKTYWHLREKLTVQGAAAFHATSDQERTDILSVRSDATVYNIPNSLEDSAFSLAHEPRTEPPVVLYLSRLHPVKGVIDRLLPAIKNVKATMKLKIVGDEDSHERGYAQEVRKAVTQMGLGERIELISGVSGEDKWRYFDEATVFVLPSHSENFGIVVAEAMARGCPFVITDEVQSAPLMAKSKAGYVVNSVAALSQAIDELLSDKDSWRNMSSRAKSFARNNFHGEHIASRIVGMYENVLASPKDGY